MVEYEDYYQLLEVERDASPDDIQRSYRKLARKYHPDVSKEDDAESRFKAINAAYEVLRDPEKRALFDKYGEHWKAISEGRRPPPGAEQVGSDFDFGGMDRGRANLDEEELRSIFEQMFGGEPRGTRSRHRRDWPMSGQDVEAKLELDLHEAFTGGERTITLSDPRTAESRSYKVKIPAGIRPGQRIRLAGQGGKGSGGADGDLYLEVGIRPNANFRLEGTDLHTRFAVPYWRAALGGKMPVKVLEGTVRVQVPAGSSSGRRIRLKGKGYRKADGSRGDLYAEIQLTVPAEPSERELELLREIETLHEGSA